MTKIYKTCILLNLIMGEKEEKITGAEEETSTLFPPTKKKSGFFSKLFKHEKSKIEEPLENQEKKPITEELPSHQHFRLTNGKTKCSNN